MSKILAFSGWGQEYDSLSGVTPEDTIHIDYSKYANMSELFADMHHYNPDVVIGWSLGGQLALRIISEEIFAPACLVLIATPYQFVANKEIKCAMDRDNFNQFYENFKVDPVKTMKRFASFVAMNDSNMHGVLSSLRQREEGNNLLRWLPWLDELESFSCNRLDFMDIPKTYAIHGRDDSLVDVTQTGLFKPLIKEYHIEIFEHCGHAPHLHDEKRVQEIIKQAL